MTHPIHRVRSFEIDGPYVLRVRFDDGTERVIDFKPVLAGELFGPLRDRAVFDRVRLDPEVHICKEITDAHDGRIEVQSKRGTGTTFNLCLPVVSTTNG